MPSEGGNGHRLLCAGPSVCPPHSAWRKDSEASLGWTQEAGRVDGVEVGGWVTLTSAPDTSVRVSIQEWK